MFNIKQLRKNKGLTQAELARLMNVRQQSIQQWESGVTSPNEANLQKMVSIIGTGEGVKQEVQVRAAIHTLLAKHYPKETLDVNIQERGMHWAIDYLTGNKAVNFVPFSSDGNEIMHKMLQMATLKSAHRGKECILMLVGERKGTADEVVALRNLTVEAALLGVAVYQLDKASELIALLYQL